MMAGLKKILIIFTVAIVMASICNTYRVAAYEPTLEEVGDKIEELYSTMTTSNTADTLTVQLGTSAIVYSQVGRVLFAENLKTNQELATASAIINAIADLQGMSTSERVEASSKFNSIDSLKNLTYTVEENGVEIKETDTNVFSIKINMDKHFTETPQEDNTIINTTTNNTTNITNTVTNTNTNKTNTTTTKNNTTSSSTSTTKNVVNTIDDTYANKAIPKTGSNFIAKRVCLGVLFGSTATLVFIIMYNKRIGMSDGTK